MGEGNCESKIASRQWGDNFCRETSICLAGPSGFPVPVRFLGHPEVFCSVTLTHFWTHVWTLTRTHAFRVFLNPLFGEPSAKPKGVSKRMVFKMASALIFSKTRHIGTRLFWYPFGCLFSSTQRGIKTEGHFGTLWVPPKPVVCTADSRGFRHFSGFRHFR